MIQLQSEELSRLGRTMLIKQCESSKNWIMQEFLALLLSKKHNALLEGIRCFLPPNRLWDVSHVLNVQFGFNDPVQDL